MMHFNANSMGGNPKGLGQANTPPAAAATATATTAATPATASDKPRIRVVALGAGQDVGRSCIVFSIGGMNVMLDCGMHNSPAERLFPDFSYITDEGRLTEHIDCLIISHFHMDHCGALPYMTEMVGYDGPIYMTYPTKAIVPLMLEDSRKVQTEFRGDTNFFTSKMIEQCMAKVVAVSLHEVVKVKGELTLQAFYASHVLGAAMFLIRVGSESVLYTGDFNMTPDRHLGSASVPPNLCPDLLITETTYANTIRDSKRAREQDFLKKIHEVVINNKGKVLIPVFALGRAQELCILLESYWERMDLNVPIYFPKGLAEKATKYYRLFITWTNENTKNTFVERNIFDFKHVLPFEEAFADAPGPMVLFASPGMLNGGTSLRVFKKWCSDEKNMIIMPGYCARGTIGAKVIDLAKQPGPKKIEIHKRMFDMNLSVQYMSFSAHADAKGILQLIRNVQPRNVMFVHGENHKMELLKTKVEKTFKIPVYKPANFEMVEVESSIDVYWDIPEEILIKAIRNCPSPSKQECPLQAFVVMNSMTDQPEVISTEEAARRMGVEWHKLSFSETFKKPEDWHWSLAANTLRQYDPDLTEKENCIEMFDGDVQLLDVENKPGHVELIWDENRDHWLELLKERLSLEKVITAQGAKRPRIEEAYL